LRVKLGMTRPPINEINATAAAIPSRVLNSAFPVS
jgi:hypothetical protein